LKICYSAESVQYFNKEGIYQGGLPGIPRHWFGSYPLNFFSAFLPHLGVCLKCFWLLCFGLAGLLSITLGAGSSSHETMVESHPQLTKVLQTWSDASKMISVSETFIFSFDFQSSFAFSVM
jgi:hypothetical protein